MSAQKSSFRWTLFLTGLLAMASSSSAAEIRWSADLYQGYLEARQHNKPLLVFFTCDCGDDCWGRRVEQEVIQSGSLNGFADRAIFVKALPDVEDTRGNYGDLKAKLKITRTPVFVVLDAQPDGVEECGRIEGYLAAAEYEANVKKMIAVWETRHPETMTRVETNHLGGPPAAFGWSTYINRGLGFQAAFPREPRIVQADSEGHIFTAPSKAPGRSRSFSIQVREIPMAVIDEIGANAWLKLNATYFSEDLNGEASGVTLHEKQESCTCQFHIVNEDGAHIARVQFVLRDNRLYTMMINTTGGDPTSLDDLLFFGSFQLIHD